MYEVVAKDNVMTELNAGAELYIVDIPTLRVMRCTDLKMNAITVFKEKAETVFLRALTNG